MLFCTKFRCTVPNILTIYTCPLCGSAHLERKLTCVDHYASGEMFHLCCCKECGFLFTQDFPVEAEIGRYYEVPEYISHTDTKKGVMNRLYHMVRNYMLKRKARLVEAQARIGNGRLLDIGTGTAYFPHTMQMRGWQVEAIEKSAQARAFAKEHFHLEVMPNEMLAELPSKSYDVITLWHVMEHLEHLNETWQRLYDLLKDEGVLIVAVPNCSSYDARKYGAYWAAYDVPRHLWHFSPDTIQRFGSKHGFVLEAHYPMPFDAFYVSMLTEKNMRHSFSFLRGMLTGTLSWLHSLIKKERSSSMIYVFHKKSVRK